MQMSQPTQMASDLDIMITHTHARTNTLAKKQAEAHSVMYFFQTAEDNMSHVSQTPESGH